MADQQIDELSLKVEVKQKNVAKDIDKISAAIDKLTSSLKGMKELSGVLDKLSNLKLPKNISAATKKVADGAPKLRTEEVTDKVLKNKDNKVALASSDALKQISEQVGGLHKMETNIEEQKKTVADLGITVEQVRASYSKLSEQTKILNDGTKQTVQVYQQVQNGMKKTVTIVDGVIRSQNEATANTQKHAIAWSKLVKSIGRIAFYRAIRTALKEITQAAKEGLGNIRSVDKELDTAMKKISLSGVTLKNSFASILSPIIKSVQPFITRIADGIANIVNRINEAKAALAGQGTYMKIVTSDMEEYKEQLDEINGSLLEFDTFTLQQRKQSTPEYTGVIPSEVGMNAEEASSVLEKFEAIKGVLITIAGVVTGMFILTKISKLITGLGTLKSALSATGKILKASLGNGIFFVVGGIIELIAGILDMVKVFKEGGTAAEKARAILTTLAGTLTVVYGIMVFFKATQMAKTIVGLVAAAATAGALIASAVTATRASSEQVKSFATGGSFNTADMFYANEDGNTELIASTNNGGAVMNMQQLQSAIYNGMRMAMADGGDKELVLKVDSSTLGKVVANSTGFVSEVNRRNSSLKLR